MRWTKSGRKQTWAMRGEFSPRGVAADPYQATTPRPKQKPLDSGLGSSRGSGTGSWVKPSAPCGKTPGAQSPLYTGKDSESPLRRMARADPGQAQTTVEPKDIRVGATRIWCGEERIDSPASESGGSCVCLLGWGGGQVPPARAQGGGGVGAGWGDGHDHRRRPRERRPRPRRHARWECIFLHLPLSPPRERRWGCLHYSHGPGSACPVRGTGSGEWIYSLFISVSV